jgi:uncharacterized protein YrrD
MFGKEGIFMSNVHYVLPIGSITGKPVVSVETGNKLGDVKDFYIDPIKGVVLGLMLAGREGGALGLPYEALHSFGYDAVMATSEMALQPAADLGFGGYPRAGDLVGTRIITVSGNKLGNIRNVLVTMQRQPRVVYSVGESMLDRLLGRDFYILASAGQALSDDGERLVVPDDTAEKGAHSIEELLNPPMTVRSFGTDDWAPDDNDTWVPAAAEGDWARVPADDFETVLRPDDDETILRTRPGVTDLEGPDVRPGKVVR